jgi:hypothetical protein
VDVPKAQRSLTDQELEILEVKGFDLLAQVESILRHGRQYQREVQRLRGILGKGQTDTANRPPLTAVRTHLAELLRACSTFTETIQEINSIAGHPVRSRERQPQRAPRNSTRKR